MVDPCETRADPDASDGSPSHARPTGKVYFAREPAGVALISRTFTSGADGECQASIS